MTMTREITGKRALVTAGGGGIGRRIAERLAEDGAHVLACDVDGDGLASLPEGIGRMVCDVSDEAAVERLFAEADTVFGGGLDILVACAGTAGPIGPIEETAAAAWRACLDVSLIGGYLCARAAVPRLRRAGGGTIVTFSSNAGLAGYAHRTAYCTAKFGIIGMTKALAAEVGVDGIRVNALCPGIVEGDRMDRVIAAEARARGVPESGVRDGYVQGNSLRQWVTADDLAETVLFLAGPGGARITGQAIPVDGHTEAR
ncbi:SDR family oxidoreductase [Marivibrio halodurans]|uniref:SDR family oxidoreductase n=1 Tax=Marivibrio halodurans TaxID=2039722 RepID=A0A8J7SLP0_9PROT|nr:SDR family oxidoreductase [Marivibrio halodurans]MBP5856983.1 SDR family oxidoreductase [Marivibrio halodurans]